MAMSSQTDTWEHMQAQQREYETVLGAFLVAFNDVESSLYDAVTEILVACGLTKFAGAAAPGKVDSAIRQLNALKEDLSDTTDLDIKALEKLAQFRNRAAHGAYRDHVSVRFDSPGLEIGFRVEAKNKKNSTEVTIKAIADNTIIAKRLLDQLMIVRARLQDAAENARTHDE